MHDAWFKNAVFYSLDVETFYDSDGDGIGDFQGLISKLEYIAGLGATCIWLLPFYPSPNRDNGYDITDYYGVDQRLGTMGDFVYFLNKAKDLGIRVIIDLVVNHTSHHHPWFQEARRDKNSKYRDYYVWSDQPLEYEKEHLMFTGEEDTVWTYDQLAGQYYLHRFYREQPDLNIGNSSVKNEILKIMEFWLQIGVDGFRIDAAQMLVEPYGLKGTEKEDLLQFINQMREFAQSRNSKVLLLAEVSAEPSEMKIFLEDEKRMHKLFNFYVNQHLFLSLASADKSPLEHALKELSDMHMQNPWLQFLRHHDELNLKILSDEDREKLYRHFAPDPAMRIYGHGIRRRLASMMNCDLQRIKMAFSLMFSLPGAHLLRYGDEIGMGDDLSLEGRISVRTPMQWAPVKNGGFSTANEDALVHPVISDQVFGYKKINVTDAQQDPGSLLNWVERLITTRKQCPELGTGSFFALDTKNVQLMCHGLQANENKIFFVHNLSAQEQHLPFYVFETDEDSLFLIFGDEAINRNHAHIAVKGHGYLWLREIKNNGS